MSVGAVAQQGPLAGVVAAHAFRLMGNAAAAQEGRVLLWSPAALAAGSGLYFALPSEPHVALAFVLAGLGLLCLLLGRRAGILMLVGAVVLGFALAKFRAEMVATPLLAATTGEVAITGRVVAVDRATASRLVLILAPAAIEGLAAERVPRRIRLSLPEKFGQPAPGTELAFKGRLSPLPAPVMPGGFDYGRKLWFEGIGATGRVISTPVVTGMAAGPAEWLDDRLSGLRALIGARIHAALDEPYASFAEALITGERSTIPPAVNQSLLISGLFHILSISGLHMWLVAGGVFWAVRAALALVPPLALAWPIKKWAAGAAVLTGLFYLLLADSGVATERSFIMVAVVFFAVMVDRPALSTRNLALAALIILIREPEAAIDASFQMSFLAVLGLVAFHEAWSRRAASRAPKPVFQRHFAVRVAAWGLSAMALSLLTSFVAGAGSSLPAAYHFGRLSPYGVLANGLAVPVVGLVVMPAAVCSVLLMPLGLEWLPLRIMEEGLRLVVLISDGIAGLQGGQRRDGAAHGLRHGAHGSGFRLAGAGGRPLAPGGTLPAGAGFRHGASAACHARPAGRSRGRERDAADGRRPAGARACAPRPLQRREMARRRWRGGEPGRGRPAPGLGLPGRSLPRHGEGPAGALCEPQGGPASRLRRGPHPDRRFSSARGLPCRARPHRPLRPVAPWCPCAASG